MMRYAIMLSRWDAATDMPPAQFFQRLTELFDERRQQDYGSVTLTQKRCMKFLPISMQSRMLIIL